MFKYILNFGYKNKRGLKKFFVQILGIKIYCYTCNDIRHKSNKLYKISNTGKEEINITRRQKNLAVKIEGQNNKIFINENFKRENFQIYIDGNDNIIDIGEIKDCKNSAIKIHGNSNNITLENSSQFIYNTNLYCSTSNSKFLLKKNTSIIGADINLRTNKSSIEIGEDCMLSDGIKIMSGDGHLITDRNTGLPLHKEGFCKIGSHVWIGQDAVIGKNTIIPDGCVIGARSVVTKAFSEENSIIAGIPAKIVRRNIEWKRDYDF